MDDRRFIYTYHQQTGEFSGQDLLSGLVVYDKDEQAVISRLMDYAKAYDNHGYIPGLPLFHIPV